MCRLGKLFFSAAVGSIAILGLVAVPAGIARADTVTKLPISSFGQMVVDSVHGHIFISDPPQKKILVTDLNGHVITAIDGQLGAEGLTLSLDSSTLYAAVYGNNAVDVISTASFAQTATYPVPGRPSAVVLQSGKLWVIYTKPNQLSSIGDINLAASPPSFQPQPVLGTSWERPILAADPSDSGVLAVGSGISAAAATYNVATDPPTVLAQTGLLSGCDNDGYIAGLAFAPGGKELSAVCESERSGSVYTYNTAGLSEVGSYAGGNYPDAVAIAPNGTVGIGAADNSGNGGDSPNLFTYSQDASTALQIYELGWGTVVNPLGLAWSRDGSILCAVTWQGSPVQYYLHVVYPSLISSTITMTGPASSQYGKPVSITGALTPASGPIPSGTTMTITRALASGGDEATFTVPVATNGSFTLSDTLPDTGAFTYTADYSGTSTIAPAQTTYNLKVTQAPTTLSITTGVLTFDYLQKISVTAHLGTTYTNRTVSIYEQPAGSTTWTLLRTGTVTSSGALGTSYRAAYNTTFKAVFTGDRHYLPLTVYHAVKVHAAVSAKQSGYYATKTIGGVVYRLYHRLHPQGVLATVTPNHAGHCLLFETQEYYKGKWYDYRSGCHDLNKSSQVAVTFNVAGDVRGIPYRIRADYERGSDTTNLSNDSPWQYFMVEK